MKCDYEKRAPKSASKFAKPDSLSPSKIGRLLTVQLTKADGINPIPKLSTSVMSADSSSR